MMLKKRRNRIILAAAVIVLMVGASLVGMEIARLYAHNQAKNVAQQYVSVTAGFVSDHNNEDSYIFRYFDVEQQERIEVNVDKASGQVRKFQTQKVASARPSAVTMNMDDLKNIIKQEIPDASIKDIILSDHPEEKYVTMTFVTKNSRGSYQLDPENGSIFARTVKFGKSIVIPSSGGDDTSGLLTLSAFKLLANQKVPGAVFQDLDIVYADEIFAAEIDLYMNGVKHELFLNARSGAELSYEYFADDWQAYGNWEPRELETPLLNIINFDANWTLVKPPANAVINIAPSEGIITIETLPPEKETAVSLFLPEQTLTLPTASAPSVKPTTAATKPQTEPTSTTADRVPTATTAVPKPTTAATSNPTSAPTPATTTTSVNNKIITMDEAKAVVRSRLPGAKIDEIKLYKNHLRYFYKVKATSGEAEVEFKIDAISGIIFDWNTDSHDN